MDDFVPVVAVRAVYAGNGSKGLVVAPEGAKGLALKRPGPQQYNVGKVAVIWDGKQRVYWATIGALKPIDPSANLAALQADDPRPFSVEVPEYHDLEEFNVGERIKTLRKARGMSQQDLADKMSEVMETPVGQTGISYIENRADRMSGEFLLAAAKVLKVPPFIFLLPTDCEALRRCECQLREYMEVVCDGRTE